MQGSTLIPALRYYDAPAAITWLEQAFGLTTQARFDAPDGSIAHAQLTSGPGMLMLSSLTGDGPLGKLMSHPSGPAATPPSTVLFLVVPDARQTHITAQAAHAEMVYSLRQMEYGGWGFTCRDPEGHLWSIGDYNPWA